MGALTATVNELGLVGALPTATAAVNAIREGGAGTTSQVSMSKQRKSEYTHTGIHPHTHTYPRAHTLAYEHTHILTPNHTRIYSSSFSLASRISDNLCSFSEALSDDSDSSMNGGLKSKPCVEINIENGYQGSVCINPSPNKRRARTPFGLFASPLKESRSQRTLCDWRLVSF